MHKLSWIAIAVQLAACALAVTLFLRDDHNAVAQIVVIVGLLSGWSLNMLGRRARRQARRDRPPVVIPPALDGELRQIRDRDGELAAIKRLRRTHRELDLVEAVRHVRALDRHQPGKFD
jgi:hypothetical protein